MILSCFVQVTLDGKADQLSAGMADPRALSAAREILESRQSVVTADCVSLQPVTFAVTLNTRPRDRSMFDGESSLEFLMEGLETSESFRLVWPDDGGVKASDLIALQFAVVG